MSAVDVGSAVAAAVAMIEVMQVHSADSAVAVECGGDGGVHSPADCSPEFLTQLTAALAVHALGRSVTSLGTAVAAAAAVAALLALLKEKLVNILFLKLS